MNATRRWALCALLIGTAPSAFAQQDEIVLGAPVRIGQLVRVPVFLRDAANTPLGKGGAGIQWIDLLITHSHPHLVVGCLGTTYPNCDVQFEAAGVLATTPLETSGTLINIASLYVRRIFSASLTLGDELELIGTITFRLDPNAPLGTTIRLQIAPTKTFLANHDRTIVESGPTLTVTDTVLDVCPTPLTTPFFGFTGAVSGCSSASISPQLSVACRAEEDIVFTTIAPLDPCDTIVWLFDTQGVFGGGSTISHQFTPGLHTVSAIITRPSGSAAFSRQVSVVQGCTATVPPTAVAGIPVTFVADTIPSGPPINVSWKFGDGTTGIGNPIEHTYQFGGTSLWEASVTLVGSGTPPPCIVRRPIEVSGPPPPRRRTARR
jgi:hypothetical protein